MALKLRARCRNSPLRRIETATSKSPAETLDDASMTSRNGPVTDRVRKKARTRAKGHRADDLQEVAAQGRHEGLEILHEIAQPQGPDDPAVGRDGMLKYIMSVLSVELGRIDICFSPRREAWISGRKRWFSMSRASFSESARTMPAASMTVILVPVFRPSRDQAIEAPPFRPGEEGGDLAFEKPGHALQARGPFGDVVRLIAGGANKVTAAASRTITDAYRRRS